MYDFWFWRSVDIQFEVLQWDTFWSSVSYSDNCWIWIRGTDKQGYGRCGNHQQTNQLFDEQYAHRQAWQLTFGDIPEELHVLHQCDNPPCVRPDHLFLGTQQDNVSDRQRKGRHGSKLNPMKWEETNRRRSETMRLKPRIAKASGHMRRGRSLTPLQKLQQIWQWSSVEDKRLLVNWIQDRLHEDSKLLEHLGR